MKRCIAKLTTRDEDAVLDVKYEEAIATIHKLMGDTSASDKRNDHNAIPDDKASRHFTPGRAQLIRKICGAKCPECNRGLCTESIAHTDGHWCGRCGFSDELQNIKYGETDAKMTFVGVAFSGRRSVMGVPLTHDGEVQNTGRSHCCWSSERTSRSSDCDGGYSRHHGLARPCQRPDHRLRIQRA